MLALPIFTASHPATIVGVRVLNFCVRDGNRWTHTTINTNLSMDLTIDQRLITLSHLREFVKHFLKDLVTHTGFEPMLTA